MDIVYFIFQFSFPKQFKDLLKFDKAKRNVHLFNTSSVYDVHQKRSFVPLCCLYYLTRPVSRLSVSIILDRGYRYTMEYLKFASSHKYTPLEWKQYAELSADNRKFIDVFMNIAYRHFIYNQISIPTVESLG